MASVNKQAVRDKVSEFLSKASIRGPNASGDEPKNPGYKLFDPNKAEDKALVERILDIPLSDDVLNQVEGGLQDPEFDCYRPTQDTIDQMYFRAIYNVLASKYQVEGQYGLNPQSEIEDMVQRFTDYFSKGAPSPL